MLISCLIQKSVWYERGITPYNTQVIVRDLFAFSLSKGLKAVL